jgi:hypothetical protein
MSKEDPLASPLYASQMGTEQTTETTAPQTLRQAGCQVRLPPPPVPTVLTRCTAFCRELQHVQKIKARKKSNRLIAM